MPPEMELPLTGGCNCGAVRYEVTEPLLRASYCHCKRCQRRTGAAASAQAHPAPGSFRIVARRPGEAAHVEAAGRRRREVVLRRLRVGDVRLEPEPLRVGRHPNGDVRCRSGRSSHGAAVRRLRRGVGTAPRRRPAEVPREPSCVVTASATTPRGSATRTRRTISARMTRRSITRATRRRSHSRSDRPTGALAGVDGSSPSEGFVEAPAHRRVVSTWQTMFWAGIIRSSPLIHAAV
jgi:hypothetical protein